MAAKTFPLEPNHATLDDAIWTQIAEHLESTGNPMSVERLVEFGRTVGAARIDTQRSLRRLYGLGMVSFIGAPDPRDFEDMTAEGGSIVLRAATVADPDLPTPGPTPDPEGHHEILVRDPTTNKWGELNGREWYIPASSVIRFGKVRLPGKNKTYLAVMDSSGAIGITKTQSQPSWFRRAVQAETKKLRPPHAFEGSDYLTQYDLDQARDLLVARGLPEDLKLLDILVDRAQRNLDVDDLDSLYRAAKQARIPGEVVSKVSTLLRKVRLPRAGYEWAFKRQPGYFARIVEHEDRPY